MRANSWMAAFVVSTAIGLAAGPAFAMCGDVTGDGQVSSTDALSVLFAAIGGHPDMMCEPCDGTTTTTIGDESSYALHVEKGGMYSGTGMHMDGNGSVTSEPAGISCGSDCDEVFPAGMEVTLTPVTDSDSYFIGWWGVVPSECEYNDDPCTVTMTRDLTVRAMFMDDWMHHDGSPMH
jgi:hypothetical protein